MNEHRLIADELERQLGHWTGAAQCFVDAEEFASRHAWESLERSIGLPVRTQLAQTVDQLLENGRTTTAAVRASRLNPGRLAEALGTKLHIHVAEGQYEGTRTLAEHGATPIRYLGRLGVLGRRSIFFE